MTNMPAAASAHAVRQPSIAARFPLAWLAPKLSAASQADMRVEILCQLPHAVMVRHGATTDWVEPGMVRALPTLTPPHFSEVNHG
jgi:hypothetical protein